MTAFVAWLQHDTAGLLTLAAVSVAVLLLMIIKFKLEPFIALIVVGLLVGLAAGLPVAQLVGTPLKVVRLASWRRASAASSATSPRSSASARCSARSWNGRVVRTRSRRACCGCSVPRERRSRWGSPA